ncbi:BTB/POZ domain-containing protein KCTD8 [Cryptosporidium felis]|nr:BTB/POZ domain-containing protein KCTD8 [Cryptosporidium felis]
MTDTRIKLNVGGIYYETTRTTLLNANDASNYFSIYLLGMERTGEDPREIFIDRNGFLFQYILEYLRTGTIVSIPDKEHIIKGLLVEADFYLLDSLSSTLTRKLEEQNMNKLNLNLMVSQNHSQSQIYSQSQISSQSQNQSQSQIFTQSQNQMFDDFEKVTGEGTYKEVISSFFVDESFKGCKNCLNNGSHKYKFSLDEDF